MRNPADDPLDLMDLLRWDEARWARVHGVRVAPSGACHAETRGGHGRPIVVTAAPLDSLGRVWGTRLGPRGPWTRYPDRESALRALVALTSLDAYAL